MKPEYPADLVEARTAALVARMPVREPEGPVYKMGKYWWDNSRNEILLHVHHGPEKKEIGPLRLCGLSPKVKKDLLFGGKQVGVARFDAWFKDVCTLEEFNKLRDPNVSSSDHLLSGPRS